MGLTPASEQAVEDALAERLARPGAGLLLDLDGTLVDSEPVHRAAFARYFAARGWDVPDAVVREFMGRRATEVFPVLDGPWRGEDPVALTAAVVDELRRGTQRPLPVPGAAETLAACDELGLPVAVVTSAHLEWADGALATLAAPRPPAVTWEDCTEGKPHPEPYRRGAALLGLDPTALVAAEDAVAGVASARAAGVGFVVGMTTSVTAAGLADADVHLADLTVLARAVRRAARG
ncbi:HAD family hydrolase [Actinotalea solisilvae]|uniref:HAD family hydrolase n=1 Tax=Actinotalea solisilvae TaxID=2072922 RepID=UPI0018F13158|nr:HAD family phosphatase [Actinotalea solisilvae]